MKKKVLSVIMYLVVAVSLGACGSTAEEVVKEKEAAVVVTAVPDSKEIDKTKEMLDVVQEFLVTEQPTSAENTEQLPANSQEVLEVDLEKPDEPEVTEENTDSKSTEKNDDVGLIDGMHPDFKEAMDSYEAFYDEYCDFMKKYNENPSDFALIMEYADMLTRSAEMSEKFEEWNNDELNDAELKYYLEVNNRVSQKLIDVAY